MLTLYNRSAAPLATSDLVKTARESSIIKTVAICNANFMLCSYFVGSYFVHSNA